MVRTRTETSQALLAAVQQTQNYDIVKDLKMLRDRYTKTSKRDFLALLGGLIEKYKTGGFAEIYDMLMRKARAGDIDAVKMLRDIQAENGADGGEVQIVDDIPAK
nr:MAG TPA: hypothetical protein [Caudoviricetes sp.]